MCQRNRFPKTKSSHCGEVPLYWWKSVCEIGRWQAFGTELLWHPRAKTIDTIMLKKMPSHRDGVKNWEHRLKAINVTCAHGSFASYESREASSSIWVDEEILFLHAKSPREWQFMAVCAGSITLQIQWNVRTMIKQITHGIRCQFIQNKREEEI